MKTIITFLILVCFVSNSQGQNDRIQVIPSIKKAGDFTEYPRATILPGQSSSIDLSEEFKQDTKLASLPVGVKIDALAHFEGQKICYSVLVTIREHKESAGSTLEKATSTFETHELMLSGLTNSGDKIEAKVDENTTFIISFVTTEKEEEKK